MTYKRIDVSCSRSEVDQMRAEFSGVEIHYEFPECNKRYSITYPEHLHEHIMIWCGSRSIEVHDE